MRKILIAITIGLCTLSGCTGVKSLSSGLENESFLEFIGEPRKYPDGVSVTIDDKSAFTAEINKGVVGRQRGNVYAISTGVHLLTVSYRDNVIYRKQLFVSAQETKKIILP